MRQLWRTLLRQRAPRENRLDRIKRAREAFRHLDSPAVKRAAPQIEDLATTIAITAEIAARELGLDMFDVQLQGALALAEGLIAEMQTGEGKTLAAVPAVVWYAQSRQGVHVMTVNDYLARRDAQWMGPIYRAMGLSVGFVQQNMSREERQAAWACDVTYATANEVGFDFLRDQLALYPEHRVHRPFATAVIDEADSILLDEARIPLVIAGGAAESETMVARVDHAVRTLRRGPHYRLDEQGRNVALTDGGIALVEHALQCGNLFETGNLATLTAVQDALQAHALLKRDVDYLVMGNGIQSVDEFKGRVVRERRWPAGLQTAIEAKERVAHTKQGRILGSITLRNLIALYPAVCGMTGTAATQAEEFRSIYGMDVEVIPTNRPVIRIDGGDAVFRTKKDKLFAVLKEIRRKHATGQPVLVGTTSVAESELLSLHLSDVPHQVLNARNEEAEAGIIAQAGQAGAVTISTNMAGRGTDIRLGEDVAGLGGLYVIGTNRHESRRIDDQLRGRAGRQGDPGRSRFFVSLEDDLMLKHAAEDPRIQLDPERVQRIVEGENLAIRRFLDKYERVTEGQRQAIQQQRQAVLTGATPAESELHRLVWLTAIDDLWADHLTSLADLRAGMHWVSLGGGDPFNEYLQRVHTLFQKIPEALEEEVRERYEQAQVNALDPTQRGATWTYLSTDQPFGTLIERFGRGLRRWMEQKR